MVSLKDKGGASVSQRTIVFGVTLVLVAISAVLTQQRGASTDGGSLHGMIEDSAVPQLVAVDGLELISHDALEVQRQSDGNCLLEHVFPGEAGNSKARTPFVVGQCIAACAQGSDCTFALMALSRASLRSQHLAAPDIPAFTHEDHNAHVSVAWCFALRCAAQFAEFHRLLRRRNEFPAGDPVRAYVSVKVKSAANWSCCVGTNTNHLRRSSIDELHVLVMSAPQYIHERLLPGLRTWLRDRRVTIFLDDVGDGQEVDGKGIFLSRAPAWKTPLTELLLMAKRRNREARDDASSVPLQVSPPSLRRRLDVHMLFPTSAQSLAPARRSINGAWKPLVLLAYAYARISPRDTPPWFALVDDDTFVHWPNLMCHLSLIGAHSGDPRLSPIVVGSTQTFHGIFHQKEFLRRTRNDHKNNNASAPSTFLPPKIRSVRYPQGGGGMVLSSAAVRDLNVCLRRLHIFYFFHPLCSPENSSLCDDFDSFATRSLRSWDDDGGSSMDRLLAEPARATVEQHVVSIAKGFADIWPAGDMRLGWTISECNRFLPYTNRHQPVSLIHVSAMFHRTLELTVGADRRHWTSAHPASFHRLRTSDDFERMDFVFRAERAALTEPLQCPTASWRSVEDRLALWWKFNASGNERNSTGIRGERRSEGAKFRRDAFFDDDGFF